MIIWINSQSKARTSFLVLKLHTYPDESAVSLWTYFGQVVIAKRLVRILKRAGE